MTSSKGEFSSPSNVASVDNSDEKYNPNFCLSEKEYKTMPTKQSSSKASTIAAKVLAGAKPTQKQVLTLAGSVLSQDESKGQSTRK